MHRAGLDGSSPQQLGSDLIWALAIDPVDRKIYMLGNTGAIRRCNPDGSNIEPFLQVPSGTNGTTHIDPYQRRLYYPSYASGQQIRRVNLDGTGDQLITASPASTAIRDFALHFPSNSIYWIQRPSGQAAQLWRAGLDGSDPQQVTTISGEPRTMAISQIHHTLYWTEQQQNNPIYRSDLNNWSPQYLRTVQYAIDLAIHDQAERVYWAEYNSGLIRKMDLDGGQPETVLADALPINISLMPLNDCNANGIDDWCEISCGASGGYCDVPGCGTGQDANRNGRLDACDDCDGNGVPDDCDVSCGTAGGPCDLPGCGFGPDCNSNEKLDACDLLGAASLDCNFNESPDECDTASSSSPDCNLNSVPDECETLGEDCNNNGIRDDCDTLTGDSGDCNLNLIPDECETLNVDCNNNGIRDDCDIITGPSEDCNLNGAPDECDPPAADCNGNTIRDDCDIITGPSNDCDGNLIPDECAIEPLPTKLYWGDRTTGKFYRSDVTGGPMEEVFSTATTPKAMVIDPLDRKLYWINEVDSAIHQANLDGSGAGFLLPGLPAGFHRDGLALDVAGRRLYFTEWNDVGTTAEGGIWAISLDNLATQYLQSTSERTYDVALHLPSNGLYFMVQDPQFSDLRLIYRKTLDSFSPGPTTVMGTLGYMMTIDPVHDEIVVGWINYIDVPFISRYSHLGASLGNKQAIGPPTGIAIDFLDGIGRIYWAIASGQIWTCDRLGSVCGPFRSGLPQPGPLAIVRAMDCNLNGLEDICEVSCGTPCGPCDVPGCGTASDCDGDSLLDVCEPFTDCNGNGIDDRCDLRAGTSTDCNLNLVADECDPDDCNNNNRPDTCDLADRSSRDCNNNDVPDECDIASAVSTDCNESGVPDECEPESYFDCNGNGQRDDCDLDLGVSQDADGDQIPDECYIFPHPLGPDPSGIDKCRFISFEVQPVYLSGQQSALRVKLLSLHHPDPPYTGGPTYPFTSFEGQTLWVGPPTQYVESSGNATQFWGAHLQCEPYFHDWTFIGVLHVTGAAIVPSSLYEVQNVAASCEGNPLECTIVSAPVQIATTRWGDIDSQFSPPSTTVQPDLADVSALVNKFRNAPGAPRKVRAVLAESVPGLYLDVAFSDISACVDAFRGRPYPNKPGYCHYENEGASCGGYSDCGGDGYCTLCP